MQPPKRVRVGATTYTVQVTGKTLLYGETDHLQTEIRLNSGQSQDSLRDTVLHEVLHAVLWISGANKLLTLDDDAEERLTRLLAPWLLTLLRDNPRLLAFLIASD